MLTKEELKANNNNVMIIMENRVMQMTGCNRETANLVANEILTLDEESEKLLSSESSDTSCNTCAKEPWCAPSRQNPKNGCGSYMDIKEVYSERKAEE